MGFEVGKKVVAKYGHPNMIFKKGDVFPLLAILKTECKCAYTIVDVGLKKDFHVVQGCTSCNTGNLNALTTSLYFDISFFAPLEEDEISSTTYEDVMQQIERTELVER